MPINITMEFVQQLMDQNTALTKQVSEMNETIKELNQTIKELKVDLCQDFGHKKLNYFSLPNK